MFETLLLLLFCALIALLGLAIVLWLIVTGRILTLDNLLLSLIGLTMGGIFGGLFAWSVRSGEFQAALNPKKPGPSDASGNPSAPKA